MDGVESVETMESSGNSLTPKNHFFTETFDLKSEMICRFCLLRLQDGQVQALFSVALNESASLAEKTMKIFDVKVSFYTFLLFFCYSFIVNLE